MRVMNLPMSCSLNIEILIPEYIFVVLSSNTSVKIYRTKNAALVKVDTEG